MLLPRILRAVPAGLALAQPKLRSVVDTPVTAIHCTAGQYVPEFLARVISDAGRWGACAWARVPGWDLVETADTITDACTLSWSSRDASARAGISDLYEGAPPATITVLELEGPTDRRNERLLGALAHAARERGHSIVIVSSSRMHRVLRRQADLELRGDALNYEPPTAQYEPDWLARLRNMASDRASLIYALQVSATVWPDELIAEAVLATNDHRDLISRVTEVLLEHAPEDVRRALGVALETGYWRAGLADANLDPAQIRPWLIPLERGWGVLDPSWASSLRNQLTRSGSLRRHTPLGSKLLRANDTRAPSGPLVDVRVLGTFEVVVDGRTVTGWSGRVGPSIFRLLLTRRAHSCSRDELLDCFWPDAPPEIARNRLQVAISGLRRAFRHVTDLPIIEYAEEAYRLTAKCHWHVDMDRFEISVRAAQAAYVRADQSRSLTLFRDAIRLYRGDFAPDAPYEEWTLVTRERLRILYLDALDRASRLELAFGQLDACIDTARLMLEHDPCREDAHRLLMQCFGEQGRSHLVDEQYQFCVRVLRGVMGSQPSPETVRVYRESRVDAFAQPQ